MRLNTRKPVGWWTKWRSSPLSLTGAVTQAVRERLERLHRQRGARLADRLLLIGKDCAAHLKKPFRSADHGDLLYDEHGLPR